MKKKTSLSCSGRCGETFHRTNACHCDYECILHDECCIDYRDTCTTGSSCNGRCNEEFSRGRECDCDPECDEYNKCCPDYQQFCKKKLDITSIAVIAEVSTIATSTDEETNTETLIRNNNTQAPSEMNESATSIGFSITDIPVIEEEGTSGDDFAEDILNNQPTYQLYSENSSVTTEPTKIESIKETVPTQESFSLRESVSEFGFTELKNTEFSRPKEASADSETMEPSVLKDKNDTIPASTGKATTMEPFMEFNYKGTVDSAQSIKNSLYTIAMSEIKNPFAVAQMTTVNSLISQFTGATESSLEPYSTSVQSENEKTKWLITKSYTHDLESVESTTVSPTSSQEESTIDNTVDSSTIAEESKTNPVTLDTEVTEEISGESYTSHIDSVGISTVNAANSLEKNTFLAINTVEPSTLVEESSHGKAETEGSKYVSTDSYTSHLASVESSTISPTSSLKENSHTFVSTAEPFTLTEEPKTSPVELTTTGTKNLYRESYTSYLASIASTEVSSTGSPKESTSAFDITEEPFASHNETKTNPVIMQTEEIQSISTESYASHLTSVQSSTVSLTSSLKESTPQFISIVELSTLSEESKMSPAELATAATKGISGETYTSNLASITTTKTTLTSALEESTFIGDNIVENSTLDEFKTSPVALQTDITKGILEEPNTIESEGIKDISTESHTSHFVSVETSTGLSTSSLKERTSQFVSTVEPSTSAGKPKTNSAELETGAKKDTYAEVYISHLALVASTKVSPTSDLSENTHQTNIIVQTPTVSDVSKPKLVTIETERNKDSFTESYASHSFTEESSTVHSTSSLKETSSLFDNTVEFSTLTENPETDPATVQAVGTISTFTHSGTSNFESAKISTIRPTIALEESSLQKDASVGSSILAKESKATTVTLETEATKVVSEELYKSHRESEEFTTISPPDYIVESTVKTDNPVEFSTLDKESKVSSVTIEAESKIISTEAHTTQLSVTSSTKISGREKSTLVTGANVELSTLAEVPKTNPVAQETQATTKVSGKSYTGHLVANHTLDLTKSLEENILSMNTITEEFDRNAIALSSPTNGPDEHTYLFVSTDKYTAFTEGSNTTFVESGKADTKEALKESSTNKFNPENDLSMNPNGSLEKNTILDKRAKEPSILVEKFNESLSTVEIEKNKETVTEPHKNRSNTEKGTTVSPSIGPFSSENSRKIPQERKIDKQTLIKDNPNDTDLCNKRPVDGITTLQNGTMFVFRGHFFWRLNQYGQAQGYPQRIQDVWGIPSPIDTVFTRCNCEGKTFFFKGTQYWRFSNSVKDNGYPKPIFRGFAGLTGKITAALSVSAYNTRPESVYFFKQEKSITYKQWKGVLKALMFSWKTLQKNATLSSSGPQMFKSVLLKRKPLDLTPVAMLTYPWFAGILEREISIRTYWKGFPKVIHSAVSVPNPRKPDGHDYFVVSKGELIFFLMKKKIQSSHKYTCMFPISLKKKKKKSFYRWELTKQTL
nr:PREDICTED: proteoglycan 4 [Latimeria chalumnae]|eukprot:XP_014344633.1 PREDICTED: proteoglycan 4 [Latimeria chalumnae]